MTKYDRVVFDGARVIGELCKGVPAQMRATLLGLGGDPAKVEQVCQAMCDPAYDESYYRGAMLDEGVIEALKDVLRPFARLEDGHD